MRWPRLDGIPLRIAVTIVAAILAIQATGVLLFVLERPDRVARNTARSLPGRIATVTRALASADAEDRPPLATAISTAGLEVAVDPPAAGEPRLPADARVRQELESLRRRIQGALTRVPSAGAVTLSSATAAEWAEDSPDPAGPIEIDVPLADGTRLRFTASNPVVLSPRWVPLAGRMILAAAAIALVAWLSARRLVLPLRRFAAAAARLGTDPTAPPLRESGPPEVRAATRAFNDMQERLRRFVDDRTQMLAAIGHDLGTPLTRLRLRAEFMEDPDQQARMMADLDEMQEMLAATMSFARDDPAREPAVDVDLAGLVRGVVADQAELGAAASYEGPEALAFRGRPSALRRAIENLVANALAYGGSARVTLSDEADQVVVTVDDHGPGIPEDKLEAVFRPFMRLDPSRARATGGIGLGLSIARAMARAHGGDVVLVNRQPGLRARVELPRRVAAA